jgi:hypothetical protein
MIRVVSWKRCTSLAESMRQAAVAPEPAPLRPEPTPPPAAPAEPPKLEPERRFRRSRPANPRLDCGSGLRRQPGPLSLKYRYRKGAMGLAECAEGCARPGLRVIAPGAAPLARRIGGRGRG